MTQPKLNEIPFPEYEGDEEKVIAIYIRLWEQVEKEIRRLSALPHTTSIQEAIRQEQLILNRLAAIFQQMRQQLNSAVVPLLMDAFLSGIAYTMITAGAVPAPQLPADTEENTKKRKIAFNKAVTNVKEKVIIRNSREYRIDKIIRDTQNDLLKATNNTEESVKRLVRSTVAKVMQDHAMRPYKKQVIEEAVNRELTKKALSQGLQRNQIAIVDRANRRWKLDTYINMVVRTKTATAYFDGIRDQVENEGMDLAIISSHPLTTDVCNHYEGMIISLNGKTAGYPTYEYLKSTKRVFHPNCRHFARPIPNLNYVPKDYMAKHKKQLSRHKEWEKQQVS